MPFPTGSNFYSGCSISRLTHCRSPKPPFREIESAKVHFPFAKGSGASSLLIG